MKKLLKAITVITSLAMILTMLPIIALADGSYYVSNESIVLHPGETASVTVGAENAAGRVDWTGSGTVSANGSAWLDNGVATIDITADSVGSGYVTVSPTNIATYDGEEIDYGYTIYVEVVSEDAGNEDPVVEPTDNQDLPEEPDNNDQPADDTPAPQADDTPAPQADEPQEQQTPEETTPEQPETTTQAEEPSADAENTRLPAGPVLTDGNNDYADLSTEDRLYTSVDGQELYIIQYPRWIAEDGSEIWNDEVFNLDMLSGFELATVNYKEVDVDSFQYKDLLRVFVLKNLETDVSNYYTLSEDGEGFSPLTYVTANGKQYIVVDFPEDFTVPEGYQMVEMTLGTNKVHALKQVRDTDGANEAAPAEEETTPAETEPAEEEQQLENTREGDTGSIVIDTRTMVALKGYETVVSPGLDSADPSDDIYYLYCLVDGETQLYSYDSGEGTLQRASIVVYNEIPTEPETVIVYETVPAPEAETVPESSNSFLKGIGWNNMQIQMKVLLIALAVAILLLIILIILFAAMSSKNKKKNKKNNKKQNRNQKNSNAKKGNNTKKSSRDQIPPRTSRKGNVRNEEDEAFFSYVKTETEEVKEAAPAEKKEEFDLDDLF